MEQLKNIEETLINQLQTQTGNLEYVNTKEFGEVVDMVKDIEEAIYYCTITKAMEHQNKEEKYYIEPKPYYYRDIDKQDGRMYYTEPMEYSNSGNNNSNTNYYNDITKWRDSREGRSPMSRKMYMESKEMHQDSIKQMQSLEKYMHELTDDIMEMVREATPEEKQVLRNKMNMLVQNIV